MIFPPEVQEFLEKYDRLLLDSEGDEEEILNTGVTYIHIANENIYGDRQIMSRKHETYYFDWLVSRGKYPEKNCICVWNS